MVAQMQYARASPGCGWACTSPPISGGRVGDFRSVRNFLSAAAEDSRIHCGIVSLPRNSSMPLSVTLLSESFWASSLALNQSLQLHLLLVQRRSELGLAGVLRH